jgi:hypothetical protein
LDADRRAVLQVSEQKAEEAKLIKARQVDYNLTWTKVALSCMEATGQLMQNGADRWTTAMGAMAQLNEHATTRGNGKSL